MNKTSFLLCILPASVVSASPTVSDVTFTQEAEVPHVAKITYKIAGAPAIVTIDIQTNAIAGGGGTWASIGGEHQWRIGGDVNRRIKGADGETKTAYWCPDADFENRTFPKSQIRAVVKAWSPETPPDYLAADLQQMSNVFYYAAAEFVPEGVGSPLYKGKFLLMRKIPAKNVTWTMGCSTNDNRVVTKGANFYTAAARRNTVKLTHDFYIGVYEMTVAQYAYYAQNLSAATLPGEDERDNHLPKGGVAYNTLRGQGWPAFDADGNFDSAASYAIETDTRSLFRLRAVTGLKSIDLPTETQWEFACRACESGPYYTGEGYSVSTVTKIARCVDNLNTADCEGTVGSTTAAVGSYMPNAWGLYDMLGNVMEWCLDRYMDFSTEIDDVFSVRIDPYGSRDNTVFVCRGGHYNVDKPNYMSAYNRGYKYSATSSADSTGHRVAVVIAEGGVEGVSEE